MIAIADIIDVLVGPMGRVVEVGAAGHVEVVAPATPNSEVSTMNTTDEYELCEDEIWVTTPSNSFAVLHVPQWLKDQLQPSQTVEVVDVGDGTQRIRIVPLQ